LDKLGREGFVFENIEKYVHLYYNINMKKGGEPCG
jgi:hypothetical protein